jgi:Pterin binding enzyme
MFIVIGENLHATRVIRRGGTRLVRSPDGDGIAFPDRMGTQRLLRIPAQIRETQSWVDGQVKHIAAAITVAMAGGDAAFEGLAYLQYVVDRQVAAGADFIDINVDELSPRLDEQCNAMAWLVGHVQSWTDTRLSIDSSHERILAAGLEVARVGTRPMLNSASLERQAVLGLAHDVGGAVMVTAAGEGGMPRDAQERVGNASRMIEAATARGIAPSEIFVDPLIFPISVDGSFGRHALDAIGTLRYRFGEVHLSGGMSNISFGMPARRLLNEVFLALAIEAGADSGIIDPLGLDARAIGPIELLTDAHRLAQDALLGIDVDCRAFLRAYRAGAFAGVGVPAPTRGLT